MEYPVGTDFFQFKFLGSKNLEAVVNVPAWWSYVFLLDEMAEGPYFFFRDDENSLVISFLTLISSKVFVCLTA